ncbi:hypothetical protein GALL_218100 [mine drainage metagenome]|uniref:Uncharacterized protein n=1 Tax=mine drainage metagenome TaxID=410659 RepID=A0A1J5S7B4_9ZZZZ
MAPDRRLLRHRQGGLSYVEALIAVVIFAVCLVPAVDALRDGLSAADALRPQAVNQQRLEARLEEVLANRFATLDDAAMAAGNSPSAIAAAYSDAAGGTDRLLVTLYRYDGSGLTGSDSGLLWVRVAIEGSSLSLDTLRTRW